MRKIDDSYYLHDATILGMARHGSFFSNWTRPQSLLTFTFNLLQQPAIQTGVLPSEHCSKGPVQWLYDEWEKVEGQPPTWAISILLKQRLAGEQ